MRKLQRCWTSPSARCAPASLVHEKHCGASSTGAPDAYAGGPVVSVTICVQLGEHEDAMYALLLAVRRARGKLNGVTRHLTCRPWGCRPGSRRSPPCSEMTVPHMLRSATMNPV